MSILKCKGVDLSFYKDLIHQTKFTLRKTKEQTVVKIIELECNMDKL